MDKYKQHETKHTPKKTHRNNRSFVQKYGVYEISVWDIFIHFRRWWTIFCVCVYLLLCCADKTMYAKYSLWLLFAPFLSLLLSRSLFFIGLFFSCDRKGNCPIKHCKKIHDPRTHFPAHRLQTTTTKFINKTLRGGRGAKRGKTENLPTNKEEKNLLAAFKVFMQIFSCCIKHLWLEPWLCIPHRDE